MNESLCKSLLIALFNTSWTICSVSLGNHSIYLNVLASQWLLLLFVCLFPFPFPKGLSLLARSSIALKFLWLLVHVCQWVLVVVVADHTSVRCTTFFWWIETNCACLPARLPFAFPPVTRMNYLPSVLLDDPVCFASLYEDRSLLQIVSWGLNIVCTPPEMTSSFLAY